MDNVMGLMWYRQGFMTMAPGREVNTRLVFQHWMLQRMVFRVGKAVADRVQCGVMCGPQGSDLRWISIFVSIVEARNYERFRELMYRKH